jgi:hypothetical protein
MARRSKAYKLTRRGVFVLALAGLAEVVYLEEKSPQRARRHNMSTFTPIFVKPSQVIDLSNWKINLPTGNMQISQPQLSSFYNPAFEVVEAVQFTALCGGQPQPGSAYPRSELREMNPDGSTASWSPATGTHVMQLTERITHLPVVKPQVICAQIHNGTDYLILVELNGQTLYVRYQDSVASVLDNNYQLGTFFDLKVQASQGYVDVFYNGAHMVHYPLNAPGCYFKAGCYVQSSISTGDLATAFGQVEISSLTVSHA